MRYFLPLFAALLFVAVAGSVEPSGHKAAQAPRPPQAPPLPAPAVDPFSPANAAPKKGCECGCEQTGKCVCATCDAGNKGAYPSCICGCVETGKCVCHDCNHPRATPLAAKPDGPHPYRVYEFADGDGPFWYVSNRGYPLATDSKHFRTEAEAQEYAGRLNGGWCPSCGKDCTCTPEDGCGDRTCPAIKPGMWRVQAGHTIPVGWRWNAVEGYAFRRVPTSQPAPQLMPTFAPPMPRFAPAPSFGGFGGGGCRS